MGAQQDALAQPGVRQVDDEVPVDVVAPDEPVDEALGERVRGRQCNRGIELRPDIGERTKRRPQILQVLHQIRSRVVDQPGGGVAERAQFVERGDDARPLIGEHVQCRRKLVQHLGDDVALPGERAGQPVQRLYRRHEVVALSIERAHEAVETDKQIANVAPAPGQGGAEVVDDVPELPQSSGVQDHRQRRQRLLGRRVGQRPVPRDCRARLQLSLRRLAQGWIQLQVHGSQQAGLTHPGLHVRRHHDVGIHRDVHEGMPIAHRHLADAADDDVVDHHRRIRFHRADAAELDMVDMGARPASHRARQGQ